MRFSTIYINFYIKLLAPVIVSVIRSAALITHDPGVGRKMRAERYVWWMIFLFSRRGYSFESVNLEEWAKFIFGVEGLVYVVSFSSNEVKVCGDLIFRVNDSGIWRYANAEVEVLGDLVGLSVSVHV